MVNDYFQDITPPSGDDARRIPIKTSKPRLEETEEDSLDSEDAPPEPRGIRSISAPLRSRPSRIDMRDVPFVSAPRARRRSPRWLIWVAAALSVVVLGGLILFAFRITTVTVTPKSHPVVFGQTSEFNAYPADTAASGTLSYTVQTIDLEDSQVVKAQGTTTIPANKASGNITVYNDFSSAPVRLLKNTRFQSPEGLIYRAPEDVIVPGKKGTVPGQLKVTVIADSAGEKYNIGPVTRFTLPGLKSSGAMYMAVYAKSTEAMANGTSAGSGPAIAPSDLTAAIAEVRGRLETKAHDAVQSLSNASSFAFADMAQVSYQDLPRTTETGGSVRIHESAHLAVPVFPAALFARAVGVQVSADAGVSSMKLIPGAGFSAHLTTQSPSLGTTALAFILSGQGVLVWNVDGNALSQALAGRDSTAFQNIVKGFPGIQEAHARIEPFWKNTFPSNPSSIKIKIEEKLPQ